MGDLVQFHASNKYLLMADHQERLRELGRIVANPTRRPFDEVAERYREGFAQALRRAPRYTSMINVLQHAVGHLSDPLTGDEKRFFTDVLEGYRAGRIPASAAIMPVRAWAVRFQVDYLLQQSFVRRYPEALMSVSDSGKGRLGGAASPVPTHHKEGPRMLKEFREFAMRGNVMDMAIGIILGLAFGKIVTSLVKDVIMPPIGLLLGNVDFTNLFINLGEAEYESLAAAQEAGAATINYGVFLNTVLDFLIVAFVIFLVVRQMNRLRRKEEAPPEEPTTKDCTYCQTTIPIQATRCPNCTSELQAA